MTGFAVFKSIILFLLLAIQLVGCGKTDSFAALEEQKALLGDSVKPVLTKPKASQELYTGNSLNLDFNNEKLGNDDGMKYTCSFDLSIDEAVSGSDCSNLPDEPSSKFDATTGKLTWGSLATPGTYEFLVSGSNIAGSDTQIFAITVTANQLPNLEKIRDQRTDANRTIIISAVNLNKTDEANTKFNCYFDDKVDEAVEATTTCDSLPGEAKNKFDTRAGILTWTPPNSAVGTYELVISISNSAGADKQVFPLFVDTDPNTPILTKVDAEYLVYVGSTFTIDLNNERIGSDRFMSYSCRFDSTVDGKVPGSRDCDSLPDSPDVKFDPVIGKLRWGPLVSEGNYEIKITGENIAGHAEQIFLVHVVTNRKPVLARILDQRINSNRTFTLNATNNNPDASLGLAYSCTYDTVLDGLVSNGLPCDGLNGVPSNKINTQTGAVSWTPNNAAIGSYEFSIKALNNSGSTEQVFKVIVDPDPDTPVLTKVASAMNAFIGDTLVLDFKNEKTGSDTGMSYSCSFDSVVDGHVTNGTNCNSLPDGSGNKFSTSAGVLNWGPLATSGTYEILIRGQNTAGLDEEVFSVHVQQNQAPRLSRILDKQLEAGQTYLVTPVNATALIGDQVTYSCRFDTVIDGAISNTANLCSSLPGQPSIKFDSSTGMLNWVPDNTMVGSYEFKIKATNSYGWDEKIFVLVVIPSTVKKVKLSYIRNVSIVTGESVAVDTNNTLTSDDSGVTYSCYYDSVVDGEVGNSLSCDLLPGTPIQKFNPVTGALNWTPNLSSQTELELKIVGAKQGDIDEKNFVVSFATQRFGDVGNSAIVFDPNSWDFGSVAINQTSAAKSVTLTNNSSSSIYIGSIVSSNSDFILNWSACPTGASAMASQTTCIINLSFRPSTSNQLGSALAVRFGKSQATSTDYSSVMGLSGRGVGSLTFAGLQTISAVTHNSLRLNWIASSQAASFLIFQVVSGNLVYLQTLVNTGGTVNSLTLSNLTTSTAYTYRVRATDFVGVVDSNTRDVSATTAANQAPSVTSGPSSWAVYTGRVIDPIDFNDSFTSSDLDRDGDVISYTCLYDTSIDGAVASNASPCTSLVNINATSPSFNQFSGILSNWKPSSGVLGTGYEFKVTATDFYGSTSSTIFTTTVTSGAPLITGVSDYVFPNNYKRAGDTLSLDFDNVRFSPSSDTDMSYTCTYKTLKTSDSSAAACSALDGTFSLNASTGALSWTLNVTSVGAYSLTVTGTNLVGSHSRTFKVDVLPAIDETQRLFHIDARFADGIRGGQNPGTTTWKDLTITNPDFGTLTNMTMSSAWSGSNSANDPMALNFDGTNDKVTFPSSVSFNNANLRFDTWIFEGSNTREKVIFTSGNSSENGIILTDKRLWQGNGTNTNYTTTVQSDAPDIYWKFDGVSTTAPNTNHATTPNASYNGVIFNNVGLIANIEDATFNLTGSAASFTGSGGSNYAYVRPNTAYSLAANWTMETWFYYPLPASCASGWCSLNRGTTNGADYTVMVANTTLNLGLYKSNTTTSSTCTTNSGLGGGAAVTTAGACYTGYSLAGLSRGWHHLAAVGSGSTTTFYVDGAQAGSPVAYKPAGDVYYVGNMSSGYTFGKIDEFAVYPSALSSARILAHYNAGRKDYCSFSLNDQLWYHLVGGISDTSNTIKLYINGAQACSVSRSSYTSATLANSTQSLILGQSTQGNATSWLGKISSFIMYSDSDTSQAASSYASSQVLFSPKLPVPAVGLSLWLRADSFLYQDVGKTTPAVANADPVAIWEDQSGQGGDLQMLTPGTATTRPHLTTNALNGQPVITFDGTLEGLRNYIPYNLPNSVFIVARYNAAGLRGRILTASTGADWMLGWYNGVWDKYYANGQWVYNSTTTLTDTSWRIYLGEQTSTLQSLYGGTTSTLLNSNTIGNAGPLGLTLGSYRGSSQWSSCDIAEIIVYNRILTTAEREAVFSYLKSRYGI